MTKTTWSLTAIAMALALAAISLGHVPASWAQSKQGKDFGTRKAACGCYVCGTLLSVSFADMDKDCAGILAEDACAEPLASLPPAQRASFCGKIKARFNVGSFQDSCPAFASACNPEQTPPAKDPSRGGTSSLPTVDPDRDGLADGFGGSPRTPMPPPKGGVSPPRLVYLVAGAPGGGKPVSAFTIYFDRAACPLALAADNRPADPKAANIIVRGRIVRGDGRVRIEAEASDVNGGAKRGPYIGEANGDGAAAVTSATRAVTSQMNLVCRR